MFLEREIFSTIIEYTPLVSIDLIVMNGRKEVLLGQRVNEPAKGFWFVPGGRIFKDERIDEAFGRISREELGREFEISTAKFLGVYQHFYDNNVFNDDFSTHYIVLGYLLQTDGDLPLDERQHDDYRWVGVDDLRKDGNVHRHVKDYFDITKGIR
ncbi:GDP-mannose mannosyl hydrolase [Hydrogenimonas sp.]